MQEEQEVSCGSRATTRISGSSARGRLRMSHARARTEHRGHPSSWPARCTSPSATTQARLSGDGTPERTGEPLLRRSGVSPQIQR